LPWSVPDSVANRHVLLAIKKQAFRWCKGLGYSLRPTLQGLRVAAQESAWQYAALQQTPRAVWDHGHVLTEYQVWVVYRVAVRQLNLYHAERTRDNRCRKLHCCRGIMETVDHILWTCPRAQACWQKLICHWTRERWRLGHLQGFLADCASRQAPGLSKVVRDQLNRAYPDEEAAYADVWRRIWVILSSICIARLWLQRNRVVFQHAIMTIEGSVQEFWETGMRQLRAIGKRESRRADSSINGDTSAALPARHSTTTPRAVTTGD